MLSGPILGSFFHELGGFKLPFLRYKVRYFGAFWGAYYLIGATWSLKWLLIVKHLHPKFVLLVVLVDWEENLLWSFIFFYLKFNRFASEFGFVHCLFILLSSHVLVDPARESILRIGPHISGLFLRFLDHFDTFKILKEFTYIDLNIFHEDNFLHLFGDIIVSLNHFVF